jgi:eukaryotic-like serine/threonine-protein kinase
MAWGYLYTGRLDEATAIVHEAQARNLTSLYMPLALYQVDFLRHDAVAMKREAADLMGKPGFEDLALYYESETSAYSGRLSQAREFTRRAVEFAQRADKKAAAAAVEAVAALRETLVGNATLAKKQAQTAMAISKPRDGEAVAALAFGLAGDFGQAQRLADDLSKRFPEDTIVQFTYLPSIRAINDRDPEKAIEALAAAAPYELAGTSESVNFCMYPVYLRGNAYLAAKQGAAAAAEFQKIIDHPGRVGNELIGALAHLQLGRAYAMQGETTKARAAYNEFLTLWKDADAAIPILTQAKAEYAQLQ